MNKKPIKDPKKGVKKNLTTTKKNPIKNIRMQGKKMKRGGKV